MNGSRIGHSLIKSFIHPVTFVEEELTPVKIPIAAFLDVKGTFNRATRDAIFQASGEVDVGGHLYAWIKSSISKRAIFMTTNEDETVHHYDT